MKYSDTIFLVGKVCLNLDPSFVLIIDRPVGVTLRSDPETLAEKACKSEGPP